MSCPDNSGKVERGNQDRSYYDLNVYFLSFSLFLFYSFTLLLFVNNSVPSVFSVVR